MLSATENGKFESLPFINDSQKSPTSVSPITTKPNRRIVTVPVPDYKQPWQSPYQIIVEPWQSPYQIIHSHGNSHTRLKTAMAIPVPDYKLQQHVTKRKQLSPIFFCIALQVNQRTVHKQHPCQRTPIERTPVKHTPFLHCTEDEEEEVIGLILTQNLITRPLPRRSRPSK